MSGFWQRNWEVLLLLLVLCAVLFVKLALAARVGDVGWEPDSYMHFLELKTIFQDFPNFAHMGLDVWTKPLFAYPFGLITAVFNIQTLFGVKALNILVVLAIGVVVWRILKSTTKHRWLPWVGLLWVNFSFLLFRSSISELTEPIFTLCLIMGVYFWVKEKWALSSLWIGIAVLGRIEGLLFVAMWGLAVLYMWRRGKIVGFKLLSLHAVLLLAPTFIWNMLGFARTGRLFFLVDTGYPTYAGKYGFGGIGHYIEGFIINEPVITVLLVLAFCLLAQSMWARKAQHYKLWVAAMWIIFFVVQNILWVRGMFGTAGLMRYFVATMPLGILLVCWFLDEMVESLYYKEQAIALLLLSILTAQIFVTFLQFKPGKHVLGLGSYPQVAAELVDVGEWVAQNINPELVVYADRPEVLYYAGRTLSNSGRNPASALQESRTGVYIWTAGWGPALGVERQDLMKKGRLLQRLNNSVYVYQLK